MDWAADGCIYLQDFPTKKCIFRVKCKWLMQTCLYPHLHLSAANISNCTALTRVKLPLFLHWLELIYSTKTQWVCLKDADPPLTFLNSVGFKSNPQGEHLFLTAHQGWSSTSVASADWYMNCAKGWYCGRAFKQKRTNFQMAFGENWPRQAPPEWRGNVLCSESEISSRSAWAASPSAGDPLQSLSH